MAKSPDDMLVRLLKKGLSADIEAIRDLLDKGANPFDRERLLSPAIYHAIKHNHFAALDAFMDHPSVQFDYGYCFYHATAMEKTELLDYLLTRIKNKGGLDKALPYSLEGAKETKNFELFCRILDLHNSPDIYKNTTYMPYIALEWTDQEYFKYFITSGANVCLPVTTDQTDSRKETTLIEYMAGSSRFHEQLAFVLQQSDIPFTGLEKALRCALRKSAIDNIRILKDVMDRQEWQFDPAWPSRITRYTFKFTPDHSLTEIFNFKSGTGERISILKNIETCQESMTRESFDRIDDQDILHEAAKELEKAGGKPEDGQFFKALSKPVIRKSPVQKHR